MKDAARRGMEDWLLPETSRAGITRIGCEGSLSASLPPHGHPRCRRAKHPCFVEGH